MAASAAMLAMAAIESSAASCAHCGTQVLAIKKCSICKQVGYCGAECQKAGWKGHKKTCEPPLPINKVFEKVVAAYEAKDWRGVFKLEGRMEEMMLFRRMAVIFEGTADSGCEAVLAIFASAHELVPTGRHDHALSVIRLHGRRVELLGKLERFRDPGETLCRIASYLFFDGKREEATRYFAHQAMPRASLLPTACLPQQVLPAGTWRGTEFFLDRYYNRARDVGQAHGFFSVECSSCLGLGKIAMDDGRAKEGLGLMRNALAGPTTLYPKPETRSPKPYEPSTLNPKPETRNCSGAADGG